MLQFLNIKKFNSKFFYSGVFKLRSFYKKLKESDINTTVHTVKTLHFGNIYPIKLSCPQEQDILLFNDAQWAKQDNPLYRYVPDESSVDGFFKGVLVDAEEAKIYHLATKQKGGNYASTRRMFLSDLVKSAENVFAQLGGKMYFSSIKEVEEIILKGIKLKRP